MNAAASDIVFGIVRCNGTSLRDFVTAILLLGFSAHSAGPRWWLFT
jgi:hypothetical protein